MLSDYFKYDETSSTCLRWKVYRKGGGRGKPKCPGDIAGVFSGKYAQVWINGEKLYVHRIVWGLQKGGIPELFDIDHFDRNPKNNCIGNLRCIPHLINQRNLSKKRNNTSGTTGVRYDKSKGRWLAKWTNLSGKDCSKSFSVLKYGNTEAFEMACKFRSNAIQSLNQQSAGYSDQHGN